MSLALPAPDMARAITRISHEILERNSGSDSITLLGIPTRGAHLAARIAANMQAIDGKPVQVGTLDTTLHRDDLRMRPPRTLMPTTIPSLGVEDRNVILVDDVLFSGRTIRAALDALGEIGRPKTVQQLLS
jgi:pyrimidine operon attenuation protein/uracil phosphoribosyltransferase